MEKLTLREVVEKVGVQSGSWLGCYVQFAIDGSQVTVRGKAKTTEVTLHIRMSGTWR